MTKVESIASRLREQIVAGKWAVGAALPSRGELAGEHGVSPATITGAIRELQKEGLVEVMQGKGAFVADRRKSEALPEWLIGLTGSYLPADTGGDWFSQAILDGIWRKANERHCPVVLLPQLAMSTEITKDYCRELGIQGVIFLGGEGYSNACHLKEEGFPLILANKPAEATTLNYLDYDNFFVIQEMGRRFMAKGHRRIGVIYAEGSVAGYFHEMRLRFLDFLMQHELVYDIRDYWRGVQRQPGRGGIFRGVEQVMEEMLSLEKPPTALFCWEPGIAQSLIKVLEKRGLRVPEDLSVVVSSYTREAEMEFSGFVMPHRQLGEKLVEELCRSVENPHHGVQKLLQPRYVEMGTVAQAGKRANPLFTD